MTENKYALSTEVNYGEDAGLGTEGINQKHFSPPMLNILQQLSPQVAAKLGNAGDIHNTGSDAVYDGAKGVEVIVCSVDNYYTEWKHRNEGGGFLGRHEVSSPIVAKALAESTEFGKYNTARGILQETFIVYGLVLTEDGPIHVAIPFVSTKISVYRKFITKVMAIRVNGQKPPLFAHVFRFTTEAEKRAKGVSYNWRIGFANEDAAHSRLDIGSDLYLMAKEFALASKGGQIKTSDEQAQEKEEVPF